LELQPAKRSFDRESLRVLPRMATDPQLHYNHAGGGTDPRDRADRAHRGRRRIPRVIASQRTPVASRTDREEILPGDPIDRWLGPLEHFLHVEAASGVVLLACTLIALGAANSSFGPDYLAFWKTKLTLGVGSFQMSYSLKHWIDDALMAIFFFVIGLEVKREIVVGELREMKRAALPIAAAIGGMVVPAGLYLAFQRGGPGARGWGIPMATDIAFVVGCMAVMSSRVPSSLRVLLLSIAIADDIGAILVIAIGYTEQIHWTALCLGFGGLALVFALGRIGVRSMSVYTLLGALVWIAFHESGVHATIAGVALGLLTPAQSRVSGERAQQLLGRASAFVRTDEWKADKHRVQRLSRFLWASREVVSPLEYLERTLHPWVGFVIMPLFALANAGVVFTPSDMTDPVAIAVAAGLVIGKPLGIVLLSWIAVQAGIAELPEGIGWRVLAAGGCLAGIGFTMALFIAGLALGGPELEAAKVGILLGSVVSGAVGVGLLAYWLPKADAIALNASA
jgi:NhaA family Na+:H+ antiporter